MKSEIILIGPSGSGKSTIAKLIAMRTGLPRRSMDELRWKYYDEIGYDRDLARHHFNREGCWGIYRYWKPFEAYAVKRLLADHDHCVVDFGAGNTVYEDDRLFHEIHETLAPYPYVILLLPSPDPQDSIEILHARTQYMPDGQDSINEHLLRHPSNYILAKLTVYTKGQTPEETCDEILRWIESQEGIHDSQPAPFSP
jgi:shikimate kinase